MPDIGVLELQIHDNAQQAGTGLKGLADALTRVRTAVGTDKIGLSKVGTELNKLAGQINNSTNKTPTVVRNITSLMNSLTGFSKIKNLDINTGSLEKLKKVIDTGINIGTTGTQMKALQQALSGSWDATPAKNAMETVAGAANTFSTNDTAGKLKAVTDAIGKFTKAYKDLPTKTKKMSDLIGQLSENIYQDRVKQIASDVQAQVEKIGTSNKSLIPLNLQQFGGLSKKQVEGQTKMDLDGMMQEVKDGFTGANAVINQTTQSVQQLKSEMQGVGGSTQDILAQFGLINQQFLSEGFASRVKDGFALAKDAADIYANRVSNVVLPKVQAISSEEMMIAYNAREATAAINRLISRLNSVPNPKGKGFSDFVNIQTGVTRNNTNVASEAGKTFNENVSQIIKVENTIDEIANAQERVKEATEQAAQAEKEYAEYFERVLEEKKEEAALTEQIKKSQEGKFYGVEIKPVYSLEQTNAFTDNITKLHLLEAQLNEAEIAYNKFANELGIGASKTMKAGLRVQQLRDAIWEYKDALEKARFEEEESAGIGEKLRTAFNGLKTGIQRMFPTLTGMIKRFGQIAKYRMLRAVLKHITAGFSEGLQNVYYYSKAIGTSLAPAMDSAAIAFQQLKNSIGAAVAPLVQAFIPVINQVASAVINVVNYLNQFFALLNGQNTWTRALPATTTAFKNQEKAAKGAGSAIKDLLADWDELNIIQSESSGSGLGSAANQAEDYLNMFEEVSEFENKIKDIVGFIDDHFGGILNLVKKIGVLILAWKISNAFTGVLDKLGTGIKGTALVYIGTEIAYDSAYLAGKNGEWNKEEVLGAIGGVFASGIGGAMIGTSIAGPGGAVLGFAIGLAAGIATTLTGWIQGQGEHNEIIKWGNLTKTREEIEADVKEQLSFDADALITVLDASITNERTARSHLNGTISDFTRSFSTLSAGIKVGLSVNSEEGSKEVTDAYESAKAAIQAVQDMITKNHNSLTVLLDNFQLVDSEGKSINDELLEQFGIADTTLKDYFVGIGEQMAHWMYLGQQSGWENGELEQLLKLMESQKRIYEKAEEYQEKLGINRRIENSVNSSVKDGVLDYESAKTQMEVQQDILKEVEQKTREQAEELYNNYTYLAGLAYGAANEAGVDTEAGKKLVEAGDTYATKAKEIIDGIEDAVEDKLAETRKTMAEEWAKTLQVVYGEEYEDAVRKNAAANVALYEPSIYDIWKNPFADNYSFNKENYLENGPAVTAEQIRKKLEQAVRINDYTGVVSFYLDNLGGTINDLFNDDLKQQIMDNLVGITEDVSIAEEIFRDIFGISTPSDIEKYTKKYYEVAEEAAQEAADGIEDATANMGTLNVGVDHVNFEFGENPLDEVKKAINDALIDGVLDTGEGLDIMTKYGGELYDRAMNEMQIRLDENGVRIATPANIQTTNNLPLANPTDLTLDETSVENGVSKGVAGLQTATGENGTKLDTIAALLRVIARQNPIRGAVANASTGIFNAAAAAAAAKVTGDIP